MAARAHTPLRGTAGASLVEVLLVVACGLGLTVGGLAALSGAGRARAGREATRLLMHDLQDIAAEARLRGQSMGVSLWSAADDSAWLQVYRDGNGNGVRVADVAAGVDPPVGPPRLAFREGSARLAVLRDVPTTDHTGVLAAGADPVRFGIAPYITFTGRRTGASGSIYVAGPDTAQYAIRVLGTTGRLRLLCLDEAQARWEGC